MVSYDKIEELELELKTLLEIESKDPKNEMNNKSIRWFKSRIAEMKKELNRYPY